LDKIKKPDTLQPDLTTGRVHNTSHKKLRPRKKCISNKYTTEYLPHRNIDKRSQTKHNFKA